MEQVSLILVGLIAFFLPFERVPTLEIGGATLKINHFIIVLTLFYWLISGLARKNLKIGTDPTRILFWLFLGISFLSLIKAVNLERALQVLLALGVASMVYWLLPSLIDTKEKLKYVLGFLLVSAVFIGLFGLYQFFADMAGAPLAVSLLKPGYDKSTFGFARIQAFSQEPLYFANFLMLPVGLLLGWHLFEEKIKGLRGGKLLLILGLLLLNFILTVSRGAYLGLLAVFLLVFLFLPRRIITLKNFYIVTTTLFLVGGMTFLLLYKAEPRALEEFTKHARVEDIQIGESVNARVQAMKDALDAYHSSPVLGIGVGNYGPYVQKYPPATPKGGWFIVNNEYFEVLAETGFLGLILFLAFLLFRFYRSLKAFFKAKDMFLKATILGLILAFIGIFIQYNFFSTLYIIHIWFLLGLMVAVENLILKNELSSNSHRS